MQEIYKLISEHKENNDCVVISGIDGDFAGEKVLIVNGKIVFRTPSSDMLIDKVESFLRTPSNGICDMGNGKVFVECLGMSERIIVCGAGTVGQEVIKLGKMLGLRVVVLEDRKEYADIAMALGADDVLCMEFNHGFEKLDERQSDYYIVVTREHKFDKVCLEHILRRENTYVGMMASRNRGTILKENLKSEGFDEACVDKIHSPIGLSIKAETPAEIAVSIYAEIIKHKNEKAKMEGFTKEILERLAIDSIEEKVILATIVDRTGSAPRDIGTKMLIYENGEKVGSVGGGWIEANALKLAKEMFEMGRINALYETDKNSRDAILCGGIETIYLEQIV